MPHMGSPGIIITLATRICKRAATVSIASKPPYWPGGATLLMSTAFAITLPHKTQRDMDHMGNSASDKVYLSAYWGAPAERVVMN